jgi:hypothetical protein
MMKFKFPKKETTSKIVQISEIPISHLNIPWIVNLMHENLVYKQKCHGSFPQSPISKSLKRSKTNQEGKFQSLFRLLAAYIEACWRTARIRFMMSPPKARIGATSSTNKQHANEKPDNYNMPIACSSVWSIQGNHPGGWPGYEESLASEFSSKSPFKSSETKSNCKLRNACSGFQGRLHDHCLIPRMFSMEYCSLQRNNLSLRMMNKGLIQSSQTLRTISSSMKMKRFYKQEPENVCITNIHSG